MHFPGPSISRFAMFVAAVVLVTIAAGAFVTGRQEIQSAAAGPVTGFSHAIAGLVAGTLTLILAMWLAPSNTRLWVRATGWSAFGLFVADAAATAGRTTPPLPDALAILHACLAPLLLACVTAIAVFTLPELAWDSEPIDLAAWPSLPMLATAVPVIVFIQILLGAAYRHKILGVMPHMAGAMIVALVLLIVCVVTVQQYPAHRSLRPMAVIAMSIALLQILLGIIAFIMRLLDFDMSIGFVALTTAHVCVGALTLAASLVLAIEFRRCRSE